MKACSRLVLCADCATSLAIRLDLFELIIGLPISNSYYQIIDVPIFQKYLIREKCLNSTV